MVRHRRDPLDDAELIGLYGDYDEPSAEGELDRHCILAPPWMNRRGDGSTEQYLPISPRTLQPGPFRRVRAEWERSVEGMRGRETGGGAPGLWSFDREAEPAPQFIGDAVVLHDTKLGRRRAGLAYRRHDATHMARWMDRHGASVQPRAARVYQLFFLQGARRKSIARRLEVAPTTVDDMLRRLRDLAGSPYQEGHRTRLVPARAAALAGTGLALLPVLGGAIAGPRGHG